MPQAIERSLATPITNPLFPAIKGAGSAISLVVAMVFTLVMGAHARQPITREKTMATTRDIAEPAPLMAGKRGLVMGVANDRSIAWGIARVLNGQGAELAFSYQGGAFGRRAVPLAEAIGAKIIEQADVEDLKSVERVFEVI